MQTKTIKLIASVFVLIALVGCSSSAQVQITAGFPAVISQPKNSSATLVFSDEFRQFVAKPNKDTTIDMGSAQVALLTNAFKGLLSTVEIVSAADQASLKQGLVITPSVQEVQLSTPSDTYLNVYEVWIKYSLDIKTAEGEQIDTWFMPAYGKTPDSFMLSRTSAIDEATVIALRDAGAKLVLDFYRIPSVNNWLRTQPVKESGDE